MFFLRRRRLATAPSAAAAALATFRRHPPPRCRSWATTDTFQQRFFVCDEHWKPGGAVFFYVGNEASKEAR